MKRDDFHCCTWRVCSHQTSKSCLLQKKIILSSPKGVEFVTFQLSIDSIGCSNTVLGGIHDEQGHMGSELIDYFSTSRHSAITCLWHSSFFLWFAYLKQNRKKTYKRHQKVGRIKFRNFVNGRACYNEGAPKVRFGKYLLRRPKSPEIFGFNGSEN